MTEDKRDRTLFNKVRVALYNQAGALAAGYFNAIDCTFELRPSDAVNKYPRILVSVSAGVVVVICIVRFRLDLQAVHDSDVHLYVRGVKTISVSEVAQIKNALAAFQQTIRSATEK